MPHIARTSMSRLQHSAGSSRLAPFWGRCSVARRFIAERLEVAPQATENRSEKIRCSRTVALLMMTLWPMARIGATALKLQKILLQCTRFVYKQSIIYRFSFHLVVFAISLTDRLIRYYCPPARLIPRTSPLGWRVLWILYILGPVRARGGSLLCHGEPPGIGRRGPQ